MTNIRFLAAVLLLLAALPVHAQENKPAEQATAPKQEQDQKAPAGEVLEGFEGIAPELDAQEVAKDTIFDELQKVQGYTLFDRGMDRLGRAAIRITDRFRYDLNDSGKTEDVEVRQITRYNRKEKRTHIGFLAGGKLKPTIKCEELLNAYRGRFARALQAVPEAEDMPAPRVARREQTGTPVGAIHYFLGAAFSPWGTPLDEVVAKGKRIVPNIVVDIVLNTKPQKRCSGALLPPS